MSDPRSVQALIDEIETLLAKITPGEWRYDTVNMEVQSSLSVDPNGPFRIIVELDGVDGWVPNGEFIAAAPRLLALCRDQLLQSQEGWRDISSAPKDGTDVLIFYHDEFVAVSSQEESGTWWLGDHPIAPTHWMPLPPLPASTPPKGTA